MPENAEMKQQQKMATLIWLLQRQKKKDQHQTKAQANGKMSTKNKTKQQRKK